MAKHKPIIKNFLLFLSIIVGVSKLQALTCTYALLKKGDKYVLLLGEAHDGAKSLLKIEQGLWEKMTEKEVSLFDRWLNQLNEHTEILIERRQDEGPLVAYFAKDFKAEDLLSQLDYNRFSNKNKTLVYKAADYRLDDLFGFCISLPHFLMGQENLLLPLAKINTKKTTDKLIVKSFVDIVQKSIPGKTFEVGFWIQKFRNIIKLIKVKSKNFDSDSKKFIDEKIASLESQINDVLLLASKYNTNDCIELFANYLLDEQRGHCEEQYCFKYWPLFLGNCLSEIGFLVEAYESLAKCDQVVIVSGKYHAVNLMKYFKILGFEVVRQEGSFRDGLANNRLAKLDAEALKAEQSAAPFIAVSEKLEQLLTDTFKNAKRASSADDKKESDKKEQSCSSEGCRNIGTKRCGKCRKVFYCSKECQQAHWAHHKDYCK